MEGVIHFENDIEELQQWDHQVRFSISSPTASFLFLCCKVFYILLYRSGFPGGLSELFSFTDCEHMSGSQRCLGQYSEEGGGGRCLVCYRSSLHIHRNLEFIAISNSSAILSR